MGDGGPDPVADADGPERKRSWPLSAYTAGFAAVFVLTAGVGLGGLDKAGELSDGLLVITLTGLLVFAASAQVFYRRMVRPVTALNVLVRAAMTHPSASPIAVTGSAELSCLVRDINQMTAKFRADFTASAALAAADEIIGRSISELVPPGRPGELAAILDSVRQGEPTRLLETQRVRFSTKPGQGEGQTILVIDDEVHYLPGPLPWW